MRYTKNTVVLGCTFWIKCKRVSRSPLFRATNFPDILICDNMQIYWESELNKAAYPCRWRRICGLLGIDKPDA